MRQVLEVISNSKNDPPPPPPHRIFFLINANQMKLFTNINLCKFYILVV